MTVTVYVEGGGSNRDTTVRCRQGFAEYCKKVNPSGRFKLVACGSRNDAFDRFSTQARRGNNGERFALLVDSEGPVKSDVSPASYLERQGNWSFEGLPEQQVFLMVQAMEAWFFADRSALASYYKQGFRIRALVGDDLHVESIAKGDLEPSLANATRDASPKGRYHKTRHAFDLLACIDPGKVAAASSFAAAFHKFLRSN